MSKFVAIQKCQVRIAKKIHTIEKGTVKNFKENPNLNDWRSLEGGKEGEASTFDITKAGEEELLASEEWTAKDAEKYLASLNVKLKKGKKQDIVDQILDARYRALNPTKPKKAS